MLADLQLAAQNLVGANWSTNVLILEKRFWFLWCESALRYHVPQGRTVPQAQLKECSSGTVPSVQVSKAGKTFSFRTTVKCC